MVLKVTPNLSRDTRKSKDSDWALNKLSDLALHERNSFVIGPFGSDLVQSDYRAAGIPVVFVRDIKRSKFEWVSNIYLSHDKAESLKAHAVMDNDIVITKMGLPPGLAAIYSGDTFGIVTADIIRLRVDKNKVDCRFLCEILNSSQIQKQVYERTAGQTRPKLTLSDYKTIQVRIPPLPEQKKIAQILSTWDSAISVTEKLIINIQQQKKALMQQLLTGKKRLMDENGVRFSGEWRKSTLSAFCDIAKGKALSSGDLTSGNYPVIAGGKSSPYKHSAYTHENIVTVSASGAYAGYVSYHNYKVWASDCSVVTAKKGNLINYFYQLLLSMQDKIYSLQSGGAQPHIYPKDLNSIQVLIPNIKEQQKITAVLSAADTEISTLEKKLACLKDEKKALMQQLLTGKRRVTVDADAA